MQIEKQTWHKLTPDNIVDDKLSIVLGSIETILKSYPYSMQTRVQKVNGAPTEIVLIVKITVK